MPSERFVTLLFTDIEGTSRLWESRPEWMSEALARHDQLLRAIIEAHGGHVFKVVGDAFCAVFESADSAARAALGCHRAIADESWGEASFLVRIAIHSGLVEVRREDFFGRALNRVSRILGSAHGGQTLVSSATRELLSDDPTHTLIWLGEFSFKGIDTPLGVWQLDPADKLQEFPPLLVSKSRGSILPRMTTSFLGRDKELKRLATFESPIISIVGAGGSGKTRLALEFGKQVEDKFESGVWLADLSSLNDAEQVIPSVASALRLADPTTDDRGQNLIAWLSGRELLLILDGCEHVLPACALLAHTISKSCPGVKLLATSRVPLGVAGEQAVRLGPLPTPPPGTDTLNVLRQYDASALFLERAGLVQEDLPSTELQLAAIGRICVRLDGLPLAIELAASRMAHLDPVTIEDRLSDRFAVLGQGDSFSPERNRTLRATLDWSFGLLSHDERRLAQWLSIFPAGWNLEFAETIAGDMLLPTNSVLGLIGSLVDKSLVTFQSTSGRGRYQFPESVRAYALEKLEQSEEGAQVRAKMVGLLEAWVEAMERSLEGGPDRVHCLRRLKEESANIRAALITLAESNPQGLMRMATALAPAWLHHGHFRDGTEWLDLSLRLVPNGTLETRSRASAMAAMLCLYQAKIESARSFVAQAIEAARSSGSCRALIRALVADAWVREETADRSGLIESTAKALDLAEREGDSYAKAMLLPVHGQALFGAGRTEESESSFVESLDAAERLGNRSLLSLGHYHLGVFRLVEGHRVEARHHLDACVRIAEQDDDHSTVAHGSEMLARLELLEGSPDRALELNRLATRLLLEGGEESCLAHNLESYARLSIAKGNLACAQRCLISAGATLQQLEMTMLPLEAALCEQTRDFLAEHHAAEEGSPQSSPILARRMLEELDTAFAAEQYDEA
jgi:predicted ATPase/class 3 adenylate cyclase